jgi:hypothetical protein
MQNDDATHAVLIEKAQKAPSLNVFVHLSPSIPNRVQEIIETEGSA